MRLKISLTTLLLLLTLASFGIAWQSYRAQEIKRFQYSKRLISQVPSASSNGEPVALVRAVNVLRSLGKERAIQALEQSMRGSGESRFIENSKIYHIVPLLFEPPDRVTPGPDRYESYVGVDDHGRWFHWELLIEQDIPFDLEGSYGGTGISADPQDAIDWAKKHGKLRRRDLLPANDPVKAADDAFKTVLRTKVVDRLLTRWASYERQQLEDELKNQLRAQAWQIISELTNSELEYPGDLANVDDSTWKRLRDFVHERNVRWDRRSQRYIVDSQ